MMNSVITQIKDIFRPVLSDRTIMKWYKKGRLIKSIITPNQVQPNSIDLTLSRNYKILETNCTEDLHRSGEYVPSVHSMPIIDPVSQVKCKSMIFDEYIILQPGQFILSASNEVLDIPNGILGFVQGRSSIARMGIQIEQAGLLDSGFSGTITFEIFNEAPYPVKLYAGMRIAQAYFFKSQYSNKIYGENKGSKYYGQIQATGSGIHKDPELDKYRK